VPVSFLPLIVPCALVLIPAIIAWKHGKRAAKSASVVSISLVAMLFFWVYVPGWVLMAKAYDGDAKSQYRLAKWYENHSEKIGALVIWPIQPDVLGGYAWLEKAAQQDYPPALYAVGVRLKYGIHVPMPKNWRGAGGNHCPQPERGQPYIDKAIELGYKPQVDEQYFYWSVYRDVYVRDNYD
jgi:TPR repeat protein